jgi:hypothetical protein
MEIAKERTRHLSEEAVLRGTLNTVKDYLTSMIASAQVYVDGEGIVTAYKIKTGALHKVIGQLGLSVPVNLPEAVPPQSEERTP